MTSPARFPGGDPTDRLRARVEESEGERRRLLMAIELLRELAGTLNYRDIVQAVARRMGYALELDRCSVFLVEKSQGTVHLVASYEDPSLRSQLVDLSQYPELKEALDEGKVVNIPDVIHEPALESVQDQLANRRVQSITVVPMSWRKVVIGAVFLRTDRTRPPLTTADVQWARLIADVAARALRTAHRFERLEARRRGSRAELVRDRERAALVGFLTRLLNSYAKSGSAGPDDLVPKASEAELDRLAGVALTVLRRETSQ
ncbi:MAG: GAF domain-containing protein [Gemmatimonadetes bacterium]|nr:GAF domain-containing protein [Gemmatimonadota bacterium]